MSISKASSISYSRFFRPALVVAALMVGATAVQAADADPALQNGRNSNGVAENKANNPVQGPDGTPSSTNPSGTNAVEKSVSDSWITAKVKSEILANSASKGLKVNVTTKGGVVALKGKLPTQDAADLVKTIAQNVKGVQSVDTSGLTVDTSSR